MKLYVGIIQPIDQLIEHIIANNKLRKKNKSRQRHQEIILHIPVTDYR